MIGPPRVLIADDHQAIRVAVREVLEANGCKVVAEARTAYEAVELARGHDPDVCVLDIGMPGGGLWAVAELAKHLPSARCIMLTILDTPEDLSAALAAGAVGYLLKDIAPEVLPAAVRSVLDGEVVLNGQLTTRVLDDMREQLARGHDTVTNTQGRAISFTPREREVLALLIDGASTADIAAQLFVRQITVRRHIADAMHKLRVSSRAEGIELLRGQWGRGPTTRDR